VHFLERMNTLTLLSVLLLVSCTLANIVSNGGFDNGGSWGFYQAGVSEDTSYCAASLQNGQFAYLNGYNAQMSQLVYLQAGTYNFSYYDAPMVPCSSSQTTSSCSYNLQVYENVAGVGDNIYYNGNVNPSQPAWSYRFFSFTITRSDDYNIFFGTMGNTCGFLVDTVSMVGGPAPIPSTTGTTGTTGYVAPATTGTTGVQIEQTAAEFCANVPSAGYYCSIDISYFYYCLSGPFLPQSAKMSCAQGTICNCAAGVDCSYGGTRSPCTYY